MSPKKITTLPLAGMLLLGLSTPVLAGTVEDVKALQDQGKHTEAYQLGHEHPEELGNPEFDFQYGIASIDAGHASEGILALERYILNFPDNARARLELARGYFSLGEDVQAREEFEEVKKLNPPAPVQAAIERYIDAIRAREGRYTTTSSFYLETGAGSDNNVNGGVDNARINLPVLGNVTVANAGVAIPDNFTHLAVGGQVSQPVAVGVTLVGGLNYDSKLYHRDNNYDMESLSGSAGVTVREDGNLFRFNGSANRLNVARTGYRDLVGVSGEWLRQLDELQVINTALQFAQMSYANTNEVRAANVVGGSAGYRKTFISTWQPVVNIGLTGSQERNQRERPDLGRNISGASLGVTLSPHPQWGINLDGNYQASLYNGPDTIMRTTRLDTNRTYNLNVTYLLSKSFSIRSDVSFSDNQSNLELYSYKKTVGSVNVRYDFK
jgi:hypothetical protein